MGLITPGIYLGVLLTSLTGSLHCVGMCGGLMINFVHTKTESVLYHGGRLLMYLSLGALAGALGEELFSLPLLKSIQIFTSILLGLFLCWTAIRVWKHQSFHLSIVPTSFLEKFQGWSHNQRFFSPAFLTGVISGLLPCGWLHTFVLTAIATRSAQKGALLLLIFWIGTVPALVTSQALIKKMSLPVAKYSSRLLAIILLVSGISTLAMKNVTLFQTSDESGEVCPFHPNEK